MTSGQASRQPRVRRNEWRSLEVPVLGAWEPVLTVSVVVPAYAADRLLPTALAGLAAQSYPDHLLEVVVVDDGPTPLVLPELRPERTRVVAVESGWGSANARHTGATVCDGEVIHWLDADMLVEREHVEAQLRWHHVVDYAVVLGHKWFVDPDPVLAAGPVGTRDAVAQGGVADLFADQDRRPHEWIEEIHGRTDGLHQAGPRALRTHVTATASVRRDLYLDSGGLEVGLRLGEDIVLGYRLAEAGAVFVPDAESRSWHLGPSHVMEHSERVNDYNDHFLADLAPDLRAKRRPGRSYRVPYLDVVLDVRGLAHGDVATVVDATLRGSLPDLVVTLLDDWSVLDDERRAPLADPHLSTRLLQATYASEPRVRLLEALPEARPDAMFRMVLPSAGWAPRPASLTGLLLHLEDTHDGLRQVLLGDGSAVRVERTSAYARARRLAGQDEDLDDVVDAVAGSAWVEAGDAGFVPVAEIGHPTVPRTGGPPRSWAEAWAHVDKVTGATGRGPGAARAASGPAPSAAARPGADPSPRPTMLRRLVARARRTG